MCNPRRVRVEATREVSQAWQVEVERTVRRSDAVVSEVQVSFPFGGTLGPRTRTVFERALAGTPGWHRGDDGTLRLSLDDGQVSYSPATGELRVTARREGVASAEGTASRRLSGTVRERATGSGEGRWFDDNFGGTSRASAEEQARQRAETDAERAARELAEAVRRRAAEAEAAASRQAADRVEEDARADAGRRLEQERARLREELDAANSRRLHALGEEALRHVNGVLARAYQDALLGYADEHRASNVRSEEADGVITIEFDMEG